MDELCGLKNCQNDAGENYVEVEVPMPQLCSSTVVRFRICDAHADLLGCHDSMDAYSLARA